MGVLRAGLPESATGGGAGFLEWVTACSSSVRLSGQTWPLFICHLPLVDRDSFEEDGGSKNASSKRSILGIQSLRRSGRSVLKNYLWKASISSP